MRRCCGVARCVLHAGLAVVALARWAAARYEGQVYCPPDPARGSLVFKSVDSELASCAPAAFNDIGKAVFDCWRQFELTVNGCQVAMLTDPAAVSGAGQLPCRMFGLSGNLTKDGTEALMWAEADGPGLLDFYYSTPQAVAALQYENAREVVRGIWAFLRDFTADLRFADDSWIDGLWKESRGADSMHGAARSGASGGAAAGAAHRLRLARRVLADRADKAEALAAAAAAAGGDQPGSPEKRRERHGPMRVYRPSAVRVSVKVPNGCKYKYSVEPTSHIFESEARQRAHIEWRSIVMTVATISVLLAVLGFGLCTYFAHKHSEYLSSYWELQAVKDHLGHEMPPSAYQRLFGEPPRTGRSDAPPEPASAPGMPAVRGALGAWNSFLARVAASLSPAMQQHASSGLQAEAGEAPLIGAGEPDGISSRSSSAHGSEIAAAAAQAEADAPPVRVRGGDDAQ